MINTIYVLIGPPNAGKSEYTQYQCRMNPDLIRVNRDSIRLSQFDSIDEKMVTSIATTLVDHALEKGKDVIFDNTNLNEEYLKKFINYFKYKANIKFKVFLPDYEELIKRNKIKNIPEKSIKRMYDIAVDWVENNKIPQDINKIDERDEVKTFNQDETLPHTIICDLDGTIALLNGRDPYDASTCENDLLNPAVMDVLKYQEHITFVSGRQDIYREQTERWLTKVIPSNISWELYMRKSGDKRRDTIVKKEIFDNNIRDKKYVKFVLDDRDQVVWMWRKELGLTCFQVNFGNF